MSVQQDRVIITLIHGLVVFIWTGILVPGGFGNRGVEGKIIAVNYARTHKKPILGICLGMQVMVIEYARCVVVYGREAYPLRERKPLVVRQPP